MELHVGIKLIKATYMTREAYNEYRGWKLPDDEIHLAKEAGYLVEYLDGGESNHPNHVGYISWSPSKVFAQAYKRSGFLGFSHVLELVRQGGRVRRPHWGKKYLYLQENAQLTRGYKGLKQSNYLAVNTGKAASRRWESNQDDILAKDWEIVE